MRDRRFIANHRGGDLAPADHRLMICWACDCVDHLKTTLSIELPEPLAAAMRIARAWQAGEAKTGEAITSARAVHVFARELSNPVDIFFARAVGHSVATAHMADHCMGPVIYGEKALLAAGVDPDTERVWQLEHLPQSIQQSVLEALAQKTGRA